MMLKEIAAGTVMHEETNVIALPAASETTKRCLGCAEVKLLSEYRFCRRRSNQKMYMRRYCVDCERKRSRTYHASHRDELLPKMRARHRGYRASVLGRAKFMLNSVRQRARKKDWQCDLDLDWVLSALEVGVCQVSAIPFDLSGAHKRKMSSPWSPSIDRIDPNKGYLKSNCRVVVVALNMALNEFGEETFRKLSIAYFNAKFPGVINGDVYRSTSAKSKRLLN